MQSCAFSQLFRVSRLQIYTGMSDTRCPEPGSFFNHVNSNSPCTGTVYFRAHVCSGYRTVCGLLLCILLYTLHAFYLCILWRQPSWALCPLRAAQRSVRFDILRRHRSPHQRILRLGVSCARNDAGALTRSTVCHCVTVLVNLVNHTELYSCTAIYCSYIGLRIHVAPGILYS